MRFLIIVFMMLMPFSAAAQNARPAGSDTGPKLLENEQIKVKELRLKPGAKIDTRTFPNTFIYALTDGALVFAPPGRTPYELTFKAGEALWLSAQEAASTNETGQEIRALLVEIKQRPPAAAKTKGKAKAGGKPAKGKSSKPVTKKKK